MGLSQLNERERRLNQNHRCGAIEPIESAPRTESMSAKDEELGKRRRLWINLWLVVPWQADARPSNPKPGRQVAPFLCILSDTFLQQSTPLTQHAKSTHTPSTARTHRPLTEHSKSTHRPFTEHSQSTHRALTVPSQSTQRARPNLSQSIQWPKT